MVADRTDRTATRVSGSAAPPPRRSRLRRLVRGLGWTLAVLIGLVLLTGLALGLRMRGRLAASLPALDGPGSIPGLSAPLTIERDALGIPTIRAANRLDAARGLGYAHAQDRFFQMDLALRRRSAGELAELMGSAALPLDREQRIFRFRALSRQLFAALPAGEKALIEAYTQGVNAGLASLEAPPFEYMALAAEPEPWRPEDTLLAVLAMFQSLQAHTREYEAQLGLMSDLLPPELFRFLTVPGTSWDAPLDGGGALPIPPIPGPEVFDARRALALPRAARLERPDGLHRLEVGGSAAETLAGSNAWAVDGRNAAGGHALLANDPHLGTSVPNLWYRASLVWPAEEGSGEHRVTGATLPGIPVVVLGSNGHVAWGFTSSGVDASDIILLETDPKAPDVYRTPAGPRRLERHREAIGVSFGRDETLDVLWTIWGPIIGKDHKGRQQVLRWVAHEPGAVNLGSVGLETARTVEEAVDVAHRSGAPAQNLIVADSAGRVAWTLLGRVPRRVGFDGRLPTSWSDGRRRWAGLLPSEEMPQVVDPAGGRIWNANNRAVGGEALAKLGDGGYRLGARASQIRDALFTMPQASAADMLRLQLDDRALFLERWHGLLQRVLTPEAVAADPRRREFRELIQRWDGHAAVDSVSYRLVRSFRSFLAQQVGATLLAPCLEADPELDYDLLDQFEGPLWQLVTEQPPHLLHPRFKSWQEQLLAAVDQVLATYERLGDGVPLSRRTWGSVNVATFQHLLSRPFPFASRWLDMPPMSLPGDLNVPRVQLPTFTATLRMVVSPGREQEGICHMPVGQSGHPSSPHYRDSHESWVRGEPTPFLPGPAIHRAVLNPAG